MPAAGKFGVVLIESSLKEGGEVRGDWIESPTAWLGEAGANVCCGCGGLAELFLEFA